MLEPLFYQRTRAYLVGRIRGHVPGRDFTIPLVIALSNHPSRGIAVDAVLAEENDVSMVFGFARSYFHADLTHVGATVRFLRSILPRKPVSDLQTHSRLLQTSTRKCTETKVLDCTQFAGEITSDDGNVSHSRSSSRIHRRIQYGRNPESGPNSNRRPQAALWMKYPGVATASSMSRIKSGSMSISLLAM